MEYDNKDWDDYPARFFCGGCEHLGDTFKGTGICSCVNSNNYEEVVNEREEACVFYKEG